MTSCACCHVRTDPCALFHKHITVLAINSFGILPMPTKMFGLAETGLPCYQVQDWTHQHGSNPATQAVLAEQRRDGELYSDTACANHGACNS